VSAVSCRPLFRNAFGPDHIVVFIEALDGSFLERLAKDAASDDEDWLRDSGDD
jgi:hypothetical protein